MATTLLHDQVFTYVEKLQYGKPANSYAKHVILFALLCLCSVSAQADQLSSLAWNCWTGSLGLTEINCIHERGQPLPKGAPEDTDIELETQVLDQVRKKTRNEETAKVEDMDWKNIEILHKGAQWTIKVHSQPNGTLWDKTRFVRLVTAVLCPGNIPCTVVIHKPAPQDIPQAE